MNAKARLFTALLIFCAIDLRAEPPPDLSAVAETPGVFIIPAPTPSPTPSPSPSPLQLRVPAIQVRCAAACLLRHADGKCQSQGSEVCGQGYACAARCMQRSSDGKCMGYTTDFCGSGAVCQPRCGSPGADGSCASYTSDACSLQSIGPSLQ